jgi:hypothetical protein
MPGTVHPGPGVRGQITYCDFKSGIGPIRQDLRKRRWKPNIHYHRQTDDLGRSFKTLKCIFYRETLRKLPLHLNKDSPGTAVKRGISIAQRLAISVDLNNAEPM